MTKVVYAGTCEKCGTLNFHRRDRVLEGEWAEHYDADCTGSVDGGNTQCWANVTLLVRTEDEFDDMVEARRAAEEERQYRSTGILFAA